MNRDTLQSIELPLISRKGLVRLFTILSRTELSNTSTLFDAGYEQAKKDVAVILEQELNVTFESNPASRLARQLRSGQ